MTASPDPLTDVGEASVRFTSALPQSLHSRLRDEAHRQGISAADYVRMILLRHFRQLDKAA